MSEPIAVGIVIAIVLFSAQFAWNCHQSEKDTDRQIDGWIDKCHELEAENKLLRDFRTFSVVVMTVKPGKESH